MFAVVSHGLLRHPNSLNGPQSGNFLDYLTSCSRKAGISNRDKLRDQMWPSTKPTARLGSKEDRDDLNKRTLEFLDFQVESFDRLYSS
ncbi:hypothetical protein OUZ56_007964 [Daphnia magna]|uniref:Uncharacterized protein n=1 Tax=Daphnia magna TaxID=35525 RepID=A0ABR0ABN0_9CRUS|nr:hypothetical protein OUZ56_007964 [Daphnia magna]